MILGDVASTIEIWPKLLEQMPMVAMMGYGLRWLAQQLDKAQLTADAVRKEKDGQLITLTDKKEAKIDALRTQLEEARLHIAEQSIREIEAFSDLTLALKDLRETDEEHTDKLQKIEDLIRHYAAECQGNRLNA